MLKEEYFLVKNQGLIQVILKSILSIFWSCIIIFVSINQCFVLSAYADKAFTFFFPTLNNKQNYTTIDI